MKNIINYYYDFDITNLYKLDDKYYFNYKENSYFFIEINRPIDEINSLFNLYNELLKRNIIIDNIITNKSNKILTPINDIYYVLLKDSTKNSDVSINDILYLQNNTVNIYNDIKLIRTNWVHLWSAKIDYYEEQLKELLNNYKLLNESIDYYIGLGECAISYIINNNPVINNIVVSHKRINERANSFDFYNPLNFILDSRVRDFSEYIKNMFFNDKINYETIRYFIDYMNFNRDEYILLISRLLFPSYYFDLYDDIVNNKIEEINIKKVLDKTNDYIIFLKNTLYYIIYNKRVNIPLISWILNIN